MNILLVVQAIYLQRSWIVQEVQILKELGHQVSTLGLPYRTPNLSYFLWSLKHISEIRKADIVFEWWAHPSAVFISKSFGKMIVLNAIGMEVINPKGLYGKLTHFAINHADGLLAESEETAKHLQRDANVIHEGINPEEFYPRAHDFTNTITTVAYLSLNNIERKDLVSLVKAFKQIGNGSKLEIIGEKDTGYQTLKKEAEGYNVEFTGAISKEDLLKRLQETSLFVMPSLQEGFPTVACEAMLCGAPVITTNIPPMNKLFVNNKEALLIEPKNPDALVDGIIKLLCNVSLRERIALNGYEKVKSKYTRQIRKDNLRQYFDTLTPKKKLFNPFWFLYWLGVCIVAPFFR